MSRLMRKPPAQNERDSKFRLLQIILNIISIKLLVEFLRTSFPNMSKASIAEPIDEAQLAHGEKLKAYEGCIAYLKDLREHNRKTGDEFDKMLVLLQAGGLTATMALFDKLPPNTPKMGVFCSWVMWTLGLIFALASFKLANTGGMTVTARLEGKMNVEDYDLTTLEHKTTADMWARRLDWGSVLMLILGLIIFSAAFYSGLDATERGKTATTPKSTPTRQEVPGTSQADPATTEATKTQMSGSTTSKEGTRSLPPPTPLPPPPQPPPRK